MDIKNRNNFNIRSLSKILKNIDKDIFFEGKGANFAGDVGYIGKNLTNL